MAKQVQQLDRVIIRFAGDSGDGMQLTGDRFTQESAAFGNDLATFPNFPAEIRAPQGTLPGVSSFQVHFADHDILTPGDAPDVLVAMNPAALKANLKDLPRGADLIVNTDEFTKRNLTKVGYEVNPIEDGSLEGYRKGAGQGGGVTRAGYALLTLEVGGKVSDEVTDAVAGYLLQKDESGDHWRGSSSRCGSGRARRSACRRISTRASGSAWPGRRTGASCCAAACSCSPSTRNG